MKLMRVGPVGAEKPALLCDDGSALDISSLVPEIDGPWMDNGGIDILRAALAEGGESLPSIEMSASRVGAPMARPGNIIAIGLNYEDHAREAGMDIPGEPIIFTKAPSSFCGPYDTVLIPRASEKTDWEVELGIVIGRRTQYLGSEAEAMDHVAGYTIVNDVSERDFQLNRGPTWIKGKSAETFCPTGPWLVTRDEVPDPANLDMRLIVNGAVRQEGNTRTMIFDVAHVVWYCSQFMVLEAGDLIASGTPPGVGMGLKPPVFLKSGDVMELEIEGLGQQKQNVAQA